MAYLRRVRCRSLYQRLGLHQANPTDISDFEPVEDSRPVADPARFFREHGRDYLVCCTDMNSEALVLVKPEDGSNVRAATFIREALRKKAEELLVIPFPQLGVVAAGVAGDVAHVTTIFLHMTMRCGSTLLAKALDASGVIHTVSEPDVYTNFARHVLHREHIPEDEKAKLLDTIRHTNTLFNYTILQDDTSKTITCYKLRGQVLLIADLLQAAITDVKSIFLYRDVFGMTDSYAHLMAEGSYWKYWLMTALRLDSMFINSIVGIAQAPPWENPVFSSVPVPHGIIWFTACVWLEQMKKALELTREDSEQCFHVVLRYGELRKYKEEMVLKVMDCLGIKCSDENAKTNIRKVFGVNSQAGHRLATRGPGGGESWIGKWEQEIIQKVLDHTKMGINQPDYVLNGTITHI